MKLLRIIHSANPRIGGPMAGILGMHECLENLGWSHEILSLDSPDQSWMQSLPFPVNAVGPGFPKGYGYTGELYRWLDRELSRFDAAIIHGIWQFHSFGAWRVLKKQSFPYAVYTHGMLDPWFKKQYPLKHLKKWLFWPWADYRVLRDAGSVFFTTQLESQLARESFWFHRWNARVVRYGVKKPLGNRSLLSEIRPELHGQRYWLYLGRVHPKKGIEMLLHSFAALQEQDPSVHLVIAGDTEDSAYLKHLKTLVPDDGDRVHWMGNVVEPLKGALLDAAELFVLPSHQENFGIAPVEALSKGTPILISNKVNIYQEVLDSHAGLVCEDETKSLQDTLLHYLSLDEESLRQMREGSLRCYKSHFSIESSCENFKYEIERLVKR